MLWREREVLLGRKGDLIRDGWTGTGLMMRACDDGVGQGVQSDAMDMNGDRVCIIVL